MIVYLLEGWMGDIEWLEGVYESEEDAQAACTELWKTRRSTNPRVPEWAQGVCKFAVEPQEVILRRT